MTMGMVLVWHVFVGVAHRRMTMKMAVRAGGHRIMPVRVMPIVMAMGVFVFQHIVLVVMPV